MRTECATVLGIRASVFFTLACVEVRHAIFAKIFTKSSQQTVAVAIVGIPPPIRTTECAAVLDIRASAFFTLACVGVKQRVVWAK